MKKALLEIPIRVSGEQHLIEVRPYDTPLQISYRFCTKHKLQFNYISPLSKQIIQYIDNVLQFGEQLQTLKLHYEKFTMNSSIRESIQSQDGTIRIHDNAIVIGSEQSINTRPQFDFTFKPEQKSGKVQNYLQKRSIPQIQQYQRFEKLNQNIINRLKNQSPMRSQPRKHVSHHVSNQVSRRGSNQSSPIRKEHLYHQYHEVSFRKESPPKQDDSVASSSSTVVMMSKTKIERVQSFKQLLKKLDYLKTPHN